MATDAKFGNPVEGVVVLNAATYAWTSDAVDVLFVQYTATGICTVTIASALIAKPGRKFTLVDRGGNASTNNIIVETAGAETIEGQSNMVLNLDTGSVTLQSDGTNLWVV